MKKIVKYSLPFVLGYLLYQSAIFGKGISTDLSGYASCGGLPAVQENWSCESHWEGSRVILTARDPENSSSELILESDSKNSSAFIFFCKPIGVRTTGFYLPYTIVPRQCGDEYVATTQTDTIAEVKIIGRNIPKKLFLDNVYQRYPTKEQYKLTRNRKIKVLTPNIKQTSRGAYQPSKIKLTGFDSCHPKTDGSGYYLSERVLLIGTSMVDASISEDSRESCILEVEITPGFLKKGSNEMEFSAGWLRQKLVDQVILN